MRHRVLEMILDDILEIISIFFLMDINIFMQKIDACAFFNIKYMTHLFIIFVIKAKFDFILLFVNFIFPICSS